MRSWCLPFGAALAGLLAACSTPTDIGTKLKGERLPVLSFEHGVEADPALSEVPIMIPPPYPNEDWTQPGGSPGKALVHLRIGERLSKAWTQKIGTGDTSQRKLLATPIVANGVLYAMDSEATVSALKADTGAPLWRHPLHFPKRSQNTAFGGGVTFGGERLFANTGSGFVVALEPATGKEIWRKDFSIPLRGAPAFADGKVYVSTQDNQLFALSAATGEEAWSASALVENAGLLGAGAPAIFGDTLVIGFSSGELNAIKTDTGQVAWQDNLSRTSRLTALASLTDIDASPVIDRGRVFAIGHGGRMIALDLATGERVWERSIGGLSTPWVAGDFLFVITADSQIVALTRKDGKIRWVTQLQRYQDVKARSGLVRWQGPVLASDRLILTASNGYVATVSPYTGALLSLTKLPSGTWLAPVVARDMLYVLTNQGEVVAFR